MSEERAHYIFREPRLRMSVPGRFLVRLASYGGYGALVVGGVVLWLSDVRQLHAVGTLIILFLVSRLIAMNQPDRSLARASLAHPNIAEYLLPETYRLVEGAVDKAALRGGDVRLYILRALISRPEIKSVLVRLDVDPAVFAQKVDKQLAETLADPFAKERQRADIDLLMTQAFAKAVGSYGHGVEPHHVFGAFGAIGDARVEHVFTLFDITGDDVEAAFLFGKGQRTHLRYVLPRSHTQRHRIMNRAWTARPTPTLDQFGTDITEEVRGAGGILLVGHEQEYQRLVNVLARPGNAHALLVGDPGSGRSAIINYLAFQMNRDRVPASLFDRRLVSLAVADVATGAATSEAQARLKRIVEEIVSAGNVVLCIPDIHLLLKTSGGEQQFSGADILVPAIRTNQFSVIGTTQHREYAQHIESASEFASAFEPILVTELSEAQSVQYLIYASLVLEAQTKIIITFKAIKEAVRIAHKYFHQKLLPGSAENLLKEALAGAANRRDTVLNPNDVVATAEQKVNIKMHTAQDQEVEQLLHLEQIIHEQFIDQEEAVKAVASALREYRAGVARSGGPIASFLFCGPTGVGKTELSKMVAQAQFGDKNAMVRFDMTEYQDAQSIHRLIGSADSGMRGALTDAVIATPYCLVLLDEFEKAHADILNLFLQVLDDGRLTDSFGRTVDFTNTVIIATSNAHSTLIKEQLEHGSGVAAIADLLKQRLTEYFRPELINRFSKIVVFKPLSREDILAIAKLNLAELAQALAQTQAITIKYAASAIAEIAERGYDPVFGARPLRQAISDALRSVLADKILRGEIKRGQTIDVSYENNTFVFKQEGY